jgi:hypothetical protein
VACAQVAKKPNHEAGFVNRPAEPFGMRHPTRPRFLTPVTNDGQGVGVQSQWRRRHYPWLTRRSLANRRLTPCPPRRTCCFAPKICSSRQLAADGRVRSSPLHELAQAETERGPSRCGWGAFQPGPVRSGCGSLGATLSPTSSGSNVC